VESPTPTAAGSLRYPAIIGVGQEEERVESFEMIRGSSSTADNLIMGELAASNGRGNVFDGVNVQVGAKHYPLVKGDGQGTFATEPSQVIVQVNGENSPVQRIDAVNGLITLVNPPQEGDLVVLNYYFKRRDSYNEAEDLTVQADGTTRQFKVKAARIVKGDNGGASATNSDIGASASTESNGSIITVPVLLVMVDGVEASVESISGSTGVFTLVSAPTAGAEILVSYFSNDYQNTYDILPAALVSSIVRAGYDAGRTDFLNGRDYVLANGNEIHWGNSASVEAGDTTVGSTEFGANQISAVMVDWRYYKASVGTGNGTTKSFTLPWVPVKGDGMGNPISDIGNGTPETYDDLTAYVGTTLATAVEAVITKLDGKTITLQTAPAVGEYVFVDSYVNMYKDDTWTVTNSVAGAAGVGKYTVRGATNGNVYQVSLDGASTSTATFLDSGTTSWDDAAGSASNAYIAPSRSRGNEIVTVTVDAGGDFVVTSNVATGTGSGSINTGTVGQTYVDTITGFTFALESATAGTLIFNVTKDFTVGVNYELGIPNLRFNVETTLGVAVSDTALLKTYNMNYDEEPGVGDVYYVTFDKVKVDFTTKYVTTFPEVTRLFGPLAQNNPIVIAADLAFKNGAQALALKQVQKAPDSNDASVNSYIAAIDEFDEPLSNSTRPCILQVVTSNQQVINHLKSSNAQQTSIRFKNERTSYFGFALGTTPEAAIGYAKALRTELLTAIYPDGAVITVPDENGNDQDIQVGGEYIACAMAGADVSPSRDVATPLTNIDLVGILRLARAMTLANASQVAQAGITVLENKFGVIKVMMALTTDLSSPLTRDPRIISVKHFVQQGVRRTCDVFIGKKMINGLTNDIEKSLNSYFSSLKLLNLIGAFQGIKAVVDDADPTIINVVVYYRPIFGLNWITVTHYLRSTL